MPRIFHAGIKGSFMDDKTHKAYFARIATHLDADFRWTADKGGRDFGCHGPVFRDYFALWRLMQRH